MGGGQIVIRTKIADLRRKKAYEEGRNITLRTMKEETGLALGTLQKLMKGDVSRIYMDTLNVLCAYFNVSSISDIMEYVPDGGEKGGE